MKMLIAAVAVGTLLAGGAADAGVITERTARQDARIDHGVANGSLMPRETERLDREQQVIARTRTRELSDGVLSPRDARHLTREQDHASRDIDRLTHNQRAR
jgi:hypothetical protein